MLVVPQPSPWWQRLDRTSPPPVPGPVLQTPDNTQYNVTLLSRPGPRPRPKYTIFVTQIQISIWTLDFYEYRGCLIATTILIIQNLKINTQTMNHVALQNRGKYISLKCRHLTMLQNNFISLVLQCEDYYLKAFAYYFGLSLLAISCVLNTHYFYFVHFRIREYNRYSIASYFGGLA